MNLTKDTIGLIVQGRGPEAAIREARSILEREVLPAYPDRAYVIREALPLDGDAARETARLLWLAQETAYLGDFKIVAREVVRALLDSLEGDPFRSLENLGFRAACYRLGAIEGPPVRLYDPFGAGIIWRSNLETLLRGEVMDPGLDPMEGLQPSNLSLVLVNLGSQ